MYICGVCVCVCVCMYVCLCVGCVCVGCMCVYVCMYVYMCFYVCMCVYVCTHVYVGAWICLLDVSIRMSSLITLPTNLWDRVSLKLNGWVDWVPVNLRGFPSLSSRCEVSDLWLFRMCAGDLNSTPHARCSKHYSLSWRSSPIQCSIEQLPFKFCLYVILFCY